MVNKVLIVLVLISACVSCAPKEHYPESHQVQRNECEKLPVGLSSYKSAIEIAGAQIGDFILGKGTINYTQEFTRLMSDEYAQEHLREQITCRAFARAAHQIEDLGAQNDLEVVDYFNTFFIYFSQPKTPEEQLQWRKDNPLPRRGRHAELTGAVSDKLSALMERGEWYVRKCHHNPPNQRPYGEIRQWLDDVEEFLRASFGAHQERSFRYEVADLSAPASITALCETRIQKGMVYLSNLAKTLPAPDS